jgi:hypothetical protein
MNKHELFFKIAQRRNTLSASDRKLLESLVRNCRYTCTGDIECPNIPATAMRDGVMCVTARQLARLTGGKEYLNAMKNSEKVRNEFSQIMYSLEDDND